MKRTGTFIFGLALLAACSKSNSKGIILQDKYPLILDSIHNVTQDTTITSYHGTPEDYWDFRSDGKVYIKEGSFSDTVNYSQPAVNTLSIDLFHSIPMQFRIGLNDQHKIYLQNIPPEVDFGGAYSRIVILNQ